MKILPKPKISVTKSCKIKILKLKIKFKNHRLFLLFIKQQKHLF